MGTFGNYINRTDGFAFTSINCSYGALFPSGVFYPDDQFPAHIITNTTWSRMDDFFGVLPGQSMDGKARLKDFNMFLMMPRIAKEITYSHTAPGN